jgi:hypothetical protein
MKAAVPELARCCSACAMFAVALGLSLNGGHVAPLPLNHGLAQPLVVLVPPAQRVEFSTSAAARRATRR